MNIDTQALPGGLVQNASDTAQAARLQNEPPPRPSSEPPRGPDTRSVDTVSLTDSVTRLRNLESTLTTLPVVDAQRVEGVQRALATGSFNVDPASTANKMLAMERALP